MSTTCTRCGGTGFLNVEQVDNETIKAAMNAPDLMQSALVILRWVELHNDSDVQVCDCCGNGDGWYGTPGEHYNDEDPPGPNGPYAYNGGLCECD